MRVIGFGLAGLLILSPSPVTRAAGGAGAEMAAAADALLQSLSGEQRARACFDLDDDERTNWHFIPRERRGLPLEAMSGEQRALSRALLETGLSTDGLATADTVISLEEVLYDMGDNPSTRNPEWYFFSIFGEPRGDGPWGWRVEGHHLSLNFTVVEGAPVAWAPSFFGANPARVRTGPRAGLRTLPREEDLARALAESLSPEQRAAAMLPGEAPHEVLTAARPSAEPLSAGLGAAHLSREQRGELWTLLDVYLSRMDEELARNRRAEIEKAGFDSVSFAWAGPLEIGAPHYYRIQGPSFLVEYDNTQNDANHVHTVWRDFDGDFGRDLLREHYASHPHDASGHSHGDTGAPASTSDGSR